MSAKVFISCGQNSPEERVVAQELSEWFEAEGYTPYVAVAVQTILDLNTGIIGELRTSDYYLFINFRREEVTSSNGEISWRGSLYTNQELAIAYAIGFEHMLLLNQREARREGVFGFIVSNIPEFEDFDKVLPLVQEAVDKAEWDPTYTRQLLAENLGFKGPEIFIDHTGERHLRTLNVHIRNRRPDLGAVDCIARLARLAPPGQELQTSPDRSLLKVTGLPGFEQTIWPQSHGTFDLLGINADNGSEVFLNSAADVVPRHPIITAPGEYQLEYEIFSQGFPPLNVTILLNLTGDPATATASVS